MIVQQRMYYHRPIQGQSRNVQDFALYCNYHVKLTTVAWEREVPEVHHEGEIIQ